MQDLNYFQTDILTLQNSPLSKQTAAVKVTDANNNFEILAEHAPLIATLSAQTKISLMTTEGLEEMSLPAGGLIYMKNNILNIFDAALTKDFK